MTCECLSFLLVLFAATALAQGVRVCTMPDGEAPSDAYSVSVNGTDVPVWVAHCNKPQLGETYSFASFDMEGEVQVTVRPAEVFEPADVVVRPRAWGIQPDIEDGAIRFNLDRPRLLSIEPYGARNVLLLFANPPEENVPDPEDPNVVYFGPGVHRVPDDVLRLSSGQTLYLAPGAVLKAAVAAEDADNVTIRGRGIIDGTEWPWLKGPAGRLISVSGCSNVTIRGVILRGSFAWTLVPMRSQNITIENIKIVNDRVQNDDGINPVNSQNVTVRGCFIRSDDDCMSIKGMSSDGEPSEDITIEDMVFWCSRARIILFAHESRAKAMRRINLSDCHIIHYTMTPFLLEPGEEMPLTDVTIEDVHINATGRREIARLRPTVNQYMKLKKPGHIRDIAFRDLHIEMDDPGGFYFEITGADPDHNVENVTIEDVSVNGERVEDLRRYILRGPHVSGLSVTAPANPDRVPLNFLPQIAAQQGYGKLALNRKAAGRPLQVARRTFEYGLATHAPAELSYALNGAYARFEAWVGMDAVVAGQPASVVFRVLVDGREAVHSGVMTPETAPKRVQVDVEGADQLRLVVEDGGDGKDYDHADWCQPVLVRPREPESN